MKRGKTAASSSISVEGRICCCKRSACRKKYCECFRLKKLCTSACKCVGCCNKEMLFNEDAAGPSFMSVALEPPVTTTLESTVAVPATASPNVFVPPVRLKVGTKKDQKKKVIKEPITKQPPVVVQRPQVPITVNCISAEVVDSVIKCMLAQAQECVDCRLNDWQTERMILDTFDDCLVDILRCMGTQATTEEDSPVTLPLDARECASVTTEETSAAAEFLDSIETTTIDVASSLAIDEGNNGTSLASENNNVKDVVDAAAIIEEIKSEPDETPAAADASNMQFIDAVNNGVFDLESFTKMYNESTDFLDLANANETIQFTENGSNLADAFEF